MNKDTIDDISDIINEKLEAIYNTAVTMANVSLLNHYKDDVQVWRKRQINDIPKLKKEVNSLIKKEITPLLRSIEVAILLSYKVADDTFKDIDINQSKIEVRANKVADKRIKSLQSSVIKTLNKLPNSIEKAQMKNITQVVNKVPKTMNKDRINVLYEGIVKQTQQGVANAPKVAYRVTLKEGESSFKRDGTPKKTYREMGFREYMDMNVRTTFQKDAGDFQLQAGHDAGLIFYLCSYHSDCANDHVDYQGKIYVDEAWESIVSADMKEKVQDYIDTHKIDTIQNVRDGEPYLTTRPNCRHYFTPMSTEEVLGSSVKKMLKDNNMEKGTYDKQNYIDLQKQRYGERQIRKYKQDLEQQKIMLEKTPVGEQRNAIQRQIDKDQASIRKYQKDVRELVKNNKALDRDYNRENPKILVNDLGYRYKVDYYKK